MYRSYIWLIFFSIVGNACVNKIGIKGIEVKTVFPVINGMGKLISYDSNAIKIYYYSKFAMYELPYQFDSFDIDDKLLKSEVRNHYFIFSKGSTQGYNYDKYRLVQNRWLSVDSVLDKEGFANLGIYDIFRNNYLSLEHSNYIVKDEQLEEIYAGRKKNDTSWIATFYLFYSKSPKFFNFSLSKELDSIKKMKLVKIKIINHPQLLEERNIFLDGYEIKSEIREVSDFDTVGLVNLFKDYSKK